MSILEYVILYGSQHIEGMNTEMFNYLANDLVAFKNGLDVFHFHLS